MSCRLENQVPTVACLPEGAEDASTLGCRRTSCSLGACPRSRARARPDRNVSAMRSSSFSSAWSSLRSQEDWLAVPRQSAVSMNSVRRSGPPSIVAKHGRSRSIRSSTSPASRIRAQLFPMFALGAQMQPRPAGRVPSPPTRAADSHQASSAPSSLSARRASASSSSRNARDWLDPRPLHRRGGWIGAR